MLTFGNNLCGGFRVYAHEISITFWEKVRAVVQLPYDIMISINNMNDQLNELQTIGPINSPTGLRVLRKPSLACVLCPFAWGLEIPVPMRSRNGDSLFAKCEFQREGHELIIRERTQALPNDVDPEIPLCLKRQWEGEVCILLRPALERWRGSMRMGFW